MKKVLFAIAALALCMNVNAKYWFSGSLGFENLSLYTTTDKAKTLDFSPSWGMALENNIEIGIGLGIVDNHYYKADNSVQQCFSFKFAPFIRWTFLQEDNFDMFVQGGFAYKVTSPSGFNFWELGLNVSPGIRYHMSDHWSIQAMCRGFEFSHMSEPEQGGFQGDLYKNQLGLNINTAMEFGLVYEF
ncbi:MAG: outer membrane beta-barrel protein [Bacteroidaceae bacterium]|nr:outer membrane beta-barrel protein [Bacteroidaceae bacterium]